MRDLTSIALASLLAAAGCAEPTAPTDVPVDASSAPLDAALDAPSLVTTDTPATTDAARPDAGMCTLASEGADGPSTSSPWRLETIDNTAYPAAVCNDGTPAIFMIRRNPATTRWVVWLEGGGNCFDGGSCRQRWNSTLGPSLMSSTTARDRADAGTLGFPGSGVFSNDPAENPALHDANVVEIQYCSSDLWAGDHDGDLSLPLANVGRWSFHGRAIALATLETLRNTEGFDEATEVVFGGGSAGSAGLYSLIDEMRELAPSSARVIGLSDGGFQINYPSYDPATRMESTASPTPLEIVAFTGHTNWGGMGDRSCDEAASTEIDHVFCRAPEFVLQNGHITTPILIVNNQYDHNQTNRLGIADGIVTDADEAAFVHRFAAHMRAQLDLVDPWHAVFANYGILHVTSQSDEALVIDIDGTVQRDAIAAWHRDPCEAFRLIEAEDPGEPAF